MREEGKIDKRKSNEERLLDFIKYKGYATLCTYLQFFWETNNLKKRKWR